MKRNLTLKKFIAKQLFDEYNILTKEVLNLLSVALFLPEEREEIFSDSQKRKIMEMLKNYDAVELIEKLHKRNLKCNNEGNIFYKFIETIELGRKEMKKRKDGKFKIMYFIEFINIETEKEKNKAGDTQTNENILEDEDYGKTFDSHESIVEVLQYLYRRINYAKLFLEMFVYHEDYLALLDEQKYIEKSVIDKYKEWLRQFKDLYPTDELIITSFFAKDIDEILKILNLLVKYLKFKRENSKQIYIPSPLLHRRFRLFNLQAFLKGELFSTLKKLKSEQKYFTRYTKKEDIKFILNSDYDIGDVVHEYGKDIALVKGSFFWREMVRLYPMLMHEIAHKLINYLRKNYKMDLEKLVENLYFRPSRNILVNDEIFFSRNDLNELMHDVFSDLISFSLFRDSYILSFIAYGGLGYLFFNTLIASPLLETEEYKFFTFENLYADVNFNPKRESSIIRLKVLLGLREKLKKKQVEEGWGEIINEDLTKEIKIYLNDFFAVYKKEFDSQSFYLASEKQQKAINAIEGLISSISRAMLSEMERFLKILLSNNEPFLPIYRDKEQNDEEKIKFYLKAFNLLEEKEIVYNVAIYREDYKTKIKIKKVKNGRKELKNKIKESLLTLVWENKMKILEKNPTLRLGILEGSILRSFVNTSKYCEIFDDELTLETDYLNLLKSKKIFEKLEGKNETFQMLIENYLNNRQDINKYFLLSDFTTFFLKRDLYKTDFSEVKLYNKTIEFAGFLDRHSILRRADITMEKLKKRWLGLILIKFDTSRKYIGLRQAPSDIKGEEKKELEKLKKIIEKGSAFFSFSAGWEDFILYINTNDLFEIFELMDKIQEYQFIKRTETIIGYNIDWEKHNKNETLNTSKEKDFLTIINIRFSKKHKKEVSPELKEELRKEEKHLQYIFPGRFDALITEQKSEEEIVELIKTILSSKKIYEYEKKDDRFNPLEVEDLVMKVFKSFGNKFIFKA